MGQLSTFGQLSQVACRTAVRPGPGSIGPVLSAQHPSSGEAGLEAQRLRGSCGVSSRLKRRRMSHLLRPQEDVPLRIPIEPEAPFRCGFVQKAALLVRGRQPLAPCFPVALLAFTSCLGIRPARVPPEQEDRYLQHRPRQGVGRSLEGGWRHPKQAQAVAGPRSRSRLQAAGRGPAPTMAAPGMCPAGGRRQRRHPTAARAVRGCRERGRRRPP